MSEVWIGLPIRCFGEPPSLTARRVIEENVAVARINGAFLFRSRGAECRRREPGFRLRELPQARTIPIYNIRVGILHHRIAGLLPLEVQPLAVAGPANLR